MLDKRRFYINGRWEYPKTPRDFPVINPSTEAAYATICLGTSEDADQAVAAAVAAFDLWRHTTADVRLAYVEKISQIYERRASEMAQTISREMGAPLDMSLAEQVGSGAQHIQDFITAFKRFSFQKPLLDDATGAMLCYEPIGVVGLITPWNWPMNQVTLKVIPALLSGCTMVHKPSEIAPLSSMLFAEIIDEAGVPAGVFNLVNGDGAEVGAHLSRHLDIEMISFTGSTRAGREIMKSAAENLKRVGLELGGKGANIIFADADEDAIKRGILHCFHNSGQSCNAPTRMLVERPLYEKALEVARHVAELIRVDVSDKAGGHIGPVVSQQQYDKIQGLIKAGLVEGARLLVGGLGRPEGLVRGYFVRPTIFADVTREMRVFREEIFGPVLVMLPFDNEEEAVALANDTPYGLTNYVQSQDPERCRRIAQQLRSGMVEINGNVLPAGSFFGGVKLSGRAREGGSWGLEEFLDSKAVSVY
ncbi:aldehyde dehydrogenase family protein [Bartonella sp. DGB2]|uniref:aldehyde dehydrogenase family protein n=1 Tax=Bartonella sp. DGB2 TaxID=3388426 RepID=UPI00398F9ED8